MTFHFCNWTCNKILVFSFSWKIFRQTVNNTGFQRFWTMTLPLNISQSIKSSKQLHCQDSWFLIAINRNILLLLQYPWNWKSVLCWNLLLDHCQLLEKWSMKPRPVIHYDKKLISTAHTGQLYVSINNFNLSSDVNFLSFKSTVVFFFYRMCVNTIESAM